MEMESDEEPQIDTSRIKRPRKIEDIRKRVRPRRIEDIRVRANEQENMEVKDPWTRTFPAEEFDQYQPNHSNTNSYRGYREEKYSNQPMYTMEKSQPQPQYKLQARSSFKPMDPTPRGSIENQASYEASARSERKSNFVHGKTSGSRMPHGTMQHMRQHYGKDYQNERTTHYEESNSYPSYREGRHGKNRTYSPEDNPPQYAPENKLRPLNSLGPTPRNRMVYSPVVDSKPSHLPGSGRLKVRQESQKPIRSVQQASASRIPQPTTKRFEANYEPQYHPAQPDYETTTYRSYRDGGRSHNNIQLKEKLQNRVRPRNSDELTGPTPRSQVYHAMNPSSQAAERLSMKPPKISHKPSVIRLLPGAGSSKRGGANYMVQ